MLGYLLADPIDIRLTRFIATFSTNHNCVVANHTRDAYVRFTLGEVLNLLEI